jgi:hypothetical protein
MSQALMRRNKLESGLKHTDDVLSVGVRMPEVQPEAEHQSALQHLVGTGQDAPIVNVQWLILFEFYT